MRSTPRKLEQRTTDEQQTVPTILNCLDNVKQELEKDYLRKLGENVDVAVTAVRNQANTIERDVATLKHTRRHWDGNRSKN